MSETDAPEAPSLLETTGQLLNRTDTKLWLLFFLVVGLIAAALTSPADWSLARRLVAGVMFGVGGTFCVILPRIIGGHDFN